jgi:hypothetical protein
MYYNLLAHICKGSQAIKMISCHVIIAVVVHGALYNKGYIIFHFDFGHVLCIH